MVRLLAICLFVLGAAASTAAAMSPAHECELDVVLQPEFEKRAPIVARMGLVILEDRYSNGFSAFWTPVREELLRTGAVSPQADVLEIATQVTYRFATHRVGFEAPSLRHLEPEQRHVVFRRMAIDLTDTHALLTASQSSWFGLNETRTFSQLGFHTAEALPFSREAAQLWIRAAVAHYLKLASVDPSLLR